MKIMFFLKKFIFHINLLKRFKNIKKINLKSIFFFFFMKSKLNLNTDNNYKGIICQGK
jgi:hypothetical protein